VPAGTAALLTASGTVSGSAVVSGSGSDIAVGVIGVGRLGVPGAPGEADAGGPAMRAAGGDATYPRRARTDRPARFIFTLIRRYLLSGCSSGL